MAAAPSVTAVLEHRPGVTNLARFSMSRVAGTRSASAEPIDFDGKRTGGGGAKMKQDDGKGGKAPGVRLRVPA